MADESPKPAAPIPRTNRPLSEALLNEKVLPPSLSACPRRLLASSAGPRGYRTQTRSLCHSIPVAAALAIALDHFHVQMLTRCCSGTAAFPRCSSAPASASPSASSSPSSSSSDAHGLPGSVSDSAQDELGKNVTTSVLVQQDAQSRANLGAVIQTGGRTLKRWSSSNTALNQMGLG